MYFTAVQTHLFHCLALTHHERAKASWLGWKGCCQEVLREFLLFDSKRPLPFTVRVSHISNRWWQLISKHLVLEQLFVHPSKFCLPLSKKQCCNLPDVSPSFLLTASSFKASAQSLCSIPQQLKTSYETRLTHWLFLSPLATQETKSRYAESTLRSEFF